MTGTLKNGKGGEGMRYAARLKAVAQGGTIHCADSTLSVQGANDVVLIFDRSHRLQTGRSGAPGR